MSVTIPVIFTAMHTSEIDLKNPVNEEAIRKLLQNYNYLGNLMPVGMIMIFQLNQLGASAPSGSIWQLCDGSEITHPDSPLHTVGINTRTTPNLLGIYPRMSSTTTDNSIGGTQTFNLAHNHTGLTGGDDPVGPQIYEGDGDRRWRFTGHRHEIIEALSDPIVVDFPAWVKFVPYMKIV